MRKKRKCKSENTRRPYICIIKIQHFVFIYIEVLGFVARKVCAEKIDISLKRSKLRDHGLSF